MGHIYAKASLRWTTKQRQIDDLLVNTGATFTVLPRDLLEDIEAPKAFMKTKLELGDGRSVEAEVYAVVIAIGDREGATVAVSFEDAKPVLGVRSLEDLGLRGDPLSGALEPARPPGVAYYYSVRQIMR